MVTDWERIETGLPDLKRLQTARTVAIDHEPLVSQATFESVVAPQTLHLTMDAGIQAETGRLVVYLASVVRSLAHHFSMFESVEIQ